MATGPASPGFLERLTARLAPLRAYRSIAVPLVSFLFAILSIWAIHLILTDIGPAQIRSALSAIDRGSVALAFLFTGLSYVALSCFDVLAVRSIAPGQILARTAALAGSLSYAVSNLLGFGALTGGALRYRIYNAAGLDGADVLRIVAVSSLTFWFGFLALAAATLILVPGQAVALRPLGLRTEELAGAALALAIAGFIVWLSRRPRTFRFLALTLPLPHWDHAIGQIVAGAVDLAASAAVLYVLLPPEVLPAFAYFVLVYSAAILLGMISHAPGGFGVFEAAILAALGQQTTAGVVAGLIVYRLVYYVVPFAIAAVGIAAWETQRNRETISAAAEQIGRLLRQVAPVVAALLVFLSGMVLLFSVAVPSETGRLELLRDWLPLFVVESSHLIGSIVGVALLVLGRGLLQRLRSAWMLTLCLLLVGAAASLAKGLDWVEAAILAATSITLYLFRPAFYRGGPISAFRLSPGWLAMVMSAFAAAVWLGLFAYRNVEYSGELWWQFAWESGAPRYLRAMVVGAALLVWITLHFLMRRAFEEGFTPDAITPEIRRMVGSSTSTQANVALLGDKRFILSDDHSALLMYGRSGGSLVAMGDPVGTGPAATDLIWRLRELADAMGGSAVYYAVGPNLLPVYIDMGLSLLKIGEVARVDLTTFSLQGSRRQDFRYADRRATKDGLEFAVLPKADVPPRIDELRAVSDAWLAMKSGHEKAFSLGAFSPVYISEFDCAVMLREGAIVAFANLWRSAEHNELSIDLMRYRPHASPILMDALFARLLLYAKAEGYHWFNLGAAPLAGLADHRLASHWNRFGTLLYRHGEEFYRFEGLKAFKQKFDPVWTPQYLACPAGLGVAGALLDVTALISGGRFGVLRK